MHYYKRNLGDYAKKAGRLTILQHGVYNLLLDACYDREEFPTREQAIEWVWAETDEEIAAVDFVLSRMFKVDSEGKYIQTRVLEEVLSYHEFCAKQGERGKAGGRPKKPNGKPEKPAGLPPEAGESLTTNQEPLTTNQSDKPNRKRFSPPSLDEVQDYCLQRRNGLDPKRFVDFYESKGWKVGNAPMKDWRAAVRTWEQRQQAPPTTGRTFEQNHTDTSWANA